VRFECRCSFLEIYKEKIMDLLNPTTLDLSIREDIKRGIYVENLTEQPVSSTAEALEVLRVGAANRHVAATGCNEFSSRSHSVFTITIKSKARRALVPPMSGSFLRGCFTTCRRRRTVSCRPDTRG
jgi:kinesin family protein 15